MIFIGLSSLLFGMAAFIIPYSRHSELNAKLKSPCCIKTLSSISSVARVLSPLVISLYSVTPLKFGKYNDYISKKIQKHCLDNLLSAEYFIATQIAVALIVFPACLTYASFLSSILFALLFGFTYVFLWLITLSELRIRRILLRLPQFMDLLSLLVSSGLDIIPAIERIIKGDDSLLAFELRQLLSSIKLGSTRTDAFKKLKKRIDHPAVTAFVDIVCQAYKLGSPISPILKIYAKKMRDDRFYRAEKEGIKASHKILLPLIICIIPSVFLIIFSPLIIMIANGNLFGWI